MAIFGGPSPSPFVQPEDAAGRLTALFYKGLLLYVILFYYFQWTTPIHRAAACIGAPLFTLIETMWTTVTHENPETGVVTIRGFHGYIGHSSFAQFWANVIFLPMLLFAYRALVSNVFLRLIWFPLNVWWLEMVEGYIIMFFFGRNVAWEYRGREAFFHGNITLQYYLPWFGMGLFVELVWEPILLPLSLALVADDQKSKAARAGGDMSISTQDTILLCAVALTLFCSPRMSMSAILQSLMGVKTSQ